MDEKFKQGLANQVRDLHDNALKLREEFIACKADGEYISDLEKIMSIFNGMYLDITRPVKD